MGVVGGETLFNVFLLIVKTKAKFSSRKRKKLNNKELDEVTVFRQNGARTATNDHFN